MICWLLQPEAGLAWLVQAGCGLGRYFFFKTSVTSKVGEGGKLIRIYMAVIHESLHLQGTPKSCGGTKNTE